MESNADRDVSFGKAARSILERDLGVTLEAEVLLPIGTPPKLHKFDLVSLNRGWVLECRKLAWRANGAAPQAKMTSITEAAGFLRDLVVPGRRAVILSRAIHATHRETLAEYYARLHRDSLDMVGVAEIDLERRTLRWLVQPGALVVNLALNRPSRDARGGVDDER